MKNKISYTEQKNPSFIFTPTLKIFTGPLCPFSLPEATLPQSGKLHTARLFPHVHYGPVQNVWNDPVASFCVCVHTHTYIRAHTPLSQPDRTFKRCGAVASLISVRSSQERGNTRGSFRASVAIGSRHSSCLRSTQLGWDTIDMEGGVFLW